MLFYFSSSCAYHSVDFMLNGCRAREREQERERVCESLRERESVRERERA